MAQVCELVNAASLVLVLCALTILLFLDLDPSSVFPGTSRTKRGKGKDCINVWLSGKQLYIFLLP